ncbi:DUF1232 domain-containing protein [Polyangium sp. y55x31]|uniref:YkvA family protein n=1 Tax=Polyangium sp. y55x31 TaxID=3042688 RepID=UPI002482E40A|nr:DUF1232 domain-containing protein [Polyangium sp. y55x31]MDI1483736.1 DUF1232 domain-containing protein [Polyangium sp. y55x31]
MKKTTDARPQKLEGKKVSGKARGLALVPLLRDAPAAWRLLRDREAALWAKALIVLSVVYCVWPLDLVPDAVPFITWIDDAGVVLLFRLILHRQLARYHEPGSEIVTDVRGPRSGTDVRVA